MTAGRHRTGRGARVLAVAAAMFAAACSSHGDDGTALTAEDQRQLNEAALVLDANTTDAPATAAHESSPHD